jgi:hypothetical protein
MYGAIKGMSNEILQVTIYQEGFVMHTTHDHETVVFSEVKVVGAKYALTVVCQFVQGL